MALPRDGFPRTAAISPRVQIVDATGSTNADLIRDVGRDPAGHPHLSVLLTDDQRAGRGRLDRSWVAPPGTALAVSVLVHVPGIPVHARGWIPLVAGAAVVRAVAAQASGPGRSVALKWPNDVLLDADGGGGKVCGILTQIVPTDHDAAVIGIGLNTRMPEGELPVPTATSFQARGLEVDEDRLVADILLALDADLHALDDAGGDADAAGVRARIEELCATIGADVAASLPDETTLVGRAVRLDADGRLVIATQGVESVVGAGDIVHLR